MEEKYWTLNFDALSEQDFQALVADVETFLQDTGTPVRMPQRDVEGWLDDFVSRYSHWAGRKFVPSARPIQDYFRIDRRIRPA